MLKVLVRRNEIRRLSDDVGFAARQDIMREHVQIIENHLENPNLIDFNELDAF